MERRELPDGFELSEARAIVTIRRPAKHIELIRCDGYAEAIHIELILKNREAILAECGRIALFDDLEDLRGYDSGVRLRLTDWGKKHRAQIVAFHILTRSRLVAMGVTVANLALGGHIRAHTNRASFDVALRKEKTRPGASTAGEIDELKKKSS